MIISDVETGVMEMNTPVHVASNHPGKDTMELKDAVPPVQTAASKIKKVKKTLFKKRNKNPNFFIPFIFFRQCQLHPRISNETWRKMP